MKNSIDLYMISGFLGSGKTTFLKNLLLDEKTHDKLVPQEKKPVIGVIVNEFGQVGIDAERIAEGKLIADDLKIVEINNGSIFCTCLKAGFMRTLIEFSKQPIDVLFIENSGIANTVDFHKMLEKILYRTEKNYKYKGSVCVVDAERFLRQVNVFTAVANQIRTADIILVNKSDRADSEKLEEINLEIRKLNMAAIVYQTSFCRIPSDMITGKIMDHGEDGDSRWHLGSNMRSWCIEFDEIIGSSILMNLLHSFSKEMIRIKGFVTTDEGLAQVDAVYDNISVQYTEKAVSSGKSRLVMISAGDTDKTEYIKMKWQALTGVTSELV